MKLSYEKIRELIRDAFADMGRVIYVIDLYDDHVICEEYKEDVKNEKYYKISYEIVDGKVQLGSDEKEVERQVEYVEVNIQASVRISAAQNKKAVDYGYKWRVRIVEFGTDVNGTHWTKKPLVAALPILEGMKVFQLTEAQHQAKVHPYGKPSTELVGWMSNVTATDTGIEGDLNILASAKELREALVDSWERGNPDLLALSVDVQGRVSKKKVAGQKVNYLEHVLKATLDVVYEPAAGGKFLRMAAARQAGQKEDSMNWKKLLASLKAQRPDLKAAIELLEAKGDDVTDDEVSELLASAMTPVDNSEELKAAIAEAVKAQIVELKAAITSIDKDGGSRDAAQDSANIALKQTQIIACKIVMHDELKGSELPELSQKQLEKQFKDTVFEVDDLRAAINDEKEYVDKLTGSGRPDGAGDIRFVAGSLDQAGDMLDAFFDRNDGIHSFKSCYIKITGDELVSGDMRAAKRLTASISSTTFAEILGDSVARRMVKEYNVPGLDEWKKIADIVPLSDFRTQRRTRMGGYGDLPAVAQAGAYTALTTPGDEEATYAATKRGGTEDITLEAIKNDDVGAIRRVPVKLSRAAKRTLHKFVFNFLSTNPTIYDSTALFTVGHGNLGSIALDAANLTLRRQAMLQQTEADSSEVLSIPPKFLIVPIELDKPGYDLIAAPRNSDFNPTSADFTRTVQLELIVVPYWTDANNWFLAADPADIPTIEIGFLDGKEVPELFVQDMPNVGSMFTNDKLTYKIRHIYSGAVIDYRGLDGSIVV